jgi:hypothetical protein
MNFSMNVLRRMSVLGFLRPVSDSEPSLRCHKRCRHEIGDIGVLMLADARIRISFSYKDPEKSVRGVPRPMSVRRRSCPEIGLPAAVIQEIGKAPPLGARK